MCLTLFCFGQVLSPLDFWTNLNTVALPALFSEPSFVQTLILPFNSNSSLNLSNSSSAILNIIQVNYSSGVQLYNVSLPTGTLGDAYSRLLGARLRQLRVTASRCSLPEYLAFYFSECVPEYSFEVEDHNDFLNRTNEAFIYRFEYIATYVINLLYSYSISKFIQ